MGSHDIHEGHDHQHGPSCGHKKVEHEGHQDYLHDGHLHHAHGDHVDEHTLAVGGQNPDACTPNHGSCSHEKDHVHGAACGHDAIAHGDHTDYVVDGHLHHAHGGHCDDHGPVKITA